MVNVPLMPNVGHNSRAMMHLNASMVGVKFSASVQLYDHVNPDSSVWINDAKSFRNAM